MRSHVSPLLIAANYGAVLTLLPVAAHQLGLWKHLPDPPWMRFDSDEVTESKAAHPLGVPDSLLGLGSYGATLLLIACAARHRPVRRLLGAKLAADGAVAAFNVGRQVFSSSRLCSWCLGTAFFTAVSVVAGRRFIAGAARGTIY